MVEYTTVIKASADGQIEEIVAINTTVKDGENIREIGSDVGVGEMMLRKGDLVTAVGGEIGIMASVGVTDVGVSPSLSSLPWLKTTRSWYKENRLLHFSPPAMKLKSIIHLIR